jgi:formylglycine-generating enzyme required for sulfatase activity
MVDLEWVALPGGEFLMGSEEEDEDARPVHPVRLGPFRLSRCEVTHAQYAGFLAATGRAAPAHWTSPRFSGAAQPVVGVSYDDAAAFCRWAGGRLPTEAEWEYAARGAGRAEAGAPRRYPWGNEEPNARLAVFHLDVGFGQTAAVGSAPAGATPAGVQDLAGNVYEWCADWYDPDYYARSPRENPAGPARGTQRVIRGGSWLSLPDVLHAAARGQYPPASRSILIGIRVACDP